MGNKQTRIRNNNMMNEVYMVDIDRPELEVVLRTLNLPSTSASTSTSTTSAVFAVPLRRSNSLPSKLFEKTEEEKPCCSQHTNKIHRRNSIVVLANAKPIEERIFDTLNYLNNIYTEYDAIENEHLSISKNTLSRNSLSSSSLDGNAKDSDRVRIFFSQLRVIQDQSGNPAVKDVLESLYQSITDICDTYTYTETLLDAEIQTAFVDQLRKLKSVELFELLCLIVGFGINTIITNSTNEKETTKLIRLSQVFYEVKAMSTWLTFRENLQAILDHFNLGFNFLHPENSTDLSMSFHCTIFLSCFRETIEERLPMEEGLKSANKNVKYTIGECSLCFAEDQLLVSRGCCKETTCLNCLQTWVKTKVLNRQLHISCPRCDNVITGGEIALLMGDEVQRYYEISTDLSGSKKEKTCPNCFYITKKPARKSKLSFTRLPVTCKRCSFVWCFKCQAPTHPGTTCSKNRSSDFLLQQWSKQLLNPQSNIRKAQRCPNIFCRTMIEKTEGCNHMTCSRCSREFCYICRKRWTLLPIPLFGKHATSKLGIAGCKENFLPNRPVARKFIRGSLCLLEVGVGFPVAIAGVAAALGLVIGLIPVILPIGIAVYVVYRVHK